MPPKKKNMTADSWHLLTIFWQTFPSATVFKHIFQLYWHLVLSLFPGILRSMLTPGICTTDQDYLPPEHHSMNSWNLLALIPHSFLGNHDPTGAEKLASNIDISHASICPIWPSSTCKTPAMELRHVTDQSWRFFPKAFGTTVRVPKKVEKKYWDIFSCYIFHILS